MNVLQPFLDKRNGLTLKHFFDIIISLMLETTHVRAAGLRLIQRLHGMIKFILIPKASHCQKSGNKMSNWVIGLILHLRQNSTYNLHIKKW